MNPIRISINALGGQGGGVLADWIVVLGEAEGWVVQSTSVPGVAQRTGATVYYLELCPSDPAGREPVQALMPVPGDVDIVIASELMEAGRAIARGLVTPDRTTLIASSHRIFAIAEKSAMGDGIVSPAKVLDACRTSSRQLVLADLQTLAERFGSVISAPLFGALAGSGALPFARGAFEAAIRRGGVGVESSLRAFSAAFALAGAPAPVAEAAEFPARAITLAALRREVSQRLPSADSADQLPLGIGNCDDPIKIGACINRVLIVDEPLVTRCSTPGTLGVELPYLRGVQRSKQRAEAIDACRRRRRIVSLDFDQQGRLGLGGHG